MNGQFYLSAIRMVATDSFVRVVVNGGVNQSDMDLFTGSGLWTPELRTRMRRVMDTVVYGICDMAMLPRVDLPAEIPAAIIAMMCAPCNWYVAASWLAGLRPAHDLAQAEETVQIERVSAGRMITLIHVADSAMRGTDEYNDFAAKIAGRFSLKTEVK